MLMKQHATATLARTIQATASAFELLTSGLQRRSKPVVQLLPWQGGDAGGDEGGDAGGDDGSSTVQLAVRCDAERLLEVLVSTQLGSPYPLRRYMASL